MPLVITACTSRKRIAPAEVMRACTLAVGSLATVSRAWTCRLRKAARVAPACQLYCGRSFSEASGAARKLGSGFAIVSAGLGFVTGDGPVPTYSLTVASGGEDNVLDRIAPRAVPKDWWTRISDLSPLSHSIAKQVSVTGGLIIVEIGRAHV